MAHAPLSPSEQADHADRPVPVGRRLIGAVLAVPAALVSGAVVLLMGFLIVRGVAYPFLAWDDPSFYADAWGGPTYAGAVAVHSLPGLVGVPLFGRRIVRGLLRAQRRVLGRPVRDGRAA